MQEIEKFDVKVSVIPNGLQKYMAVIISKNFVFIDSIPFMSSGLDALVKNLTDDYFKYLSQEFSGDLELELVKQREFTQMDIWTVFKSFLNINCLIDVNFILLYKMSVSVKRFFIYSQGSE